MLVVGVDPDTKATGITIWSDTADPIFLLAEAKGRFTYDRFAEMSWQIQDILSRPVEIDILVVEMPVVYPKSKVRPNDTKNLAVVAGMALSAGSRAKKVLFPEPREWRGTISKEIVQSRILDSWTPDLDHIPLGKRTHVIDSLGLAHWGMNGHYGLESRQTTQKMA